MNKPRSYKFLVPVMLLLGYVCLSSALLLQLSGLITLGLLLFGIFNFWMALRLLKMQTENPAIKRGTQ